MELIKDDRSETLKECRGKNSLNYWYIFLKTVKILPEQEKNPTFWNEWAQKTLKEALSMQELNKNKAKNLILFLGDGERQSFTPWLKLWKVSKGWVLETKGFGLSEDWSAYEAEMKRFISVVHKRRNEISLCEQHSDDEELRWRHPFGPRSGLCWSSAADGHSHTWLHALSCCFSSNLPLLIIKQDLLGILFFFSRTLCFCRQVRLWTKLQRSLCFTSWVTEKHLYVTWKFELLVLGLDTKGLQPASDRFNIRQCSHRPSEWGRSGRMILFFQSPV